MNHGHGTLTQTPKYQKTTVQHNFSTKQTRQLEMDWSQQNNTENGFI